MVDIAPATDGARNEITQLTAQLTMSLDANSKTQRVDIRYFSPQLPDGTKIPKRLRLHTLRVMAIVLAKSIEEDEKS